MQAKACIVFPSPNLRSAEETGEERLPGIGPVDVENAHIGGECFDFKHRFALRSDENYMGKTVMIQNTEMTQRMAAGSRDCLIRDFTS